MGLASKCSEQDESIQDLHDTFDPNRNLLSAFSRDNVEMYHSKYTKSYGHWEKNLKILWLMSYHIDILGKNASTLSKVDVQIFIYNGCD